MSARWRSWRRRALFCFVVAFGVVFAVFETGLAEHWLRGAVIEQIEEATGARVELGGFHLHTLALRIELDGLTLHGLEGAGKPPLLHAAHVSLELRILSFFGREIALDELIIDQPRLAVRFEKNGHSNLPTPKIHAGNSPWSDTLFNLRIGRLVMRDGSALLNDRRVPLDLQGRSLQFLLHYDAPAAGAEAYVGNLRWQQVEFAAQHEAPFRFDVSAKFTLHRSSFELDELIWKMPHSELNLRAELPSFAQSDWNFRYRGRLTLADLRTILREPLIPDAIVDFSGQARYTSGEWTAGGHYNGREINLAYQWFHSRGLESSGDYELARNLLVVPNFGVHALGGSLSGRVEMDTKTLAFRTQTQLRGAGLTAAFAAVDNNDFPVNTLHWDALMDVDSVNSWVANFQHFRSKGESRWSPPTIPVPGVIPTTAWIEYDTSEDAKNVLLKQSEITTPKSSLEMDGTLGALDSALEVKLKTDDLFEWDDFINIIRGIDAVPENISGKITFRGRILGPLGGPTFDGHLHASEARYDTLYWDEINGDLDYSPDEFGLTDTTVRRGQTSANVAVHLEFDGDWSFLPESAWTLEARLQHAASSDVQELFGMKYPVSGFLSGTFRGSGTRIAPVLDGNFAFEQIEAKGYQFDRLNGQLHIAHDEYRLTHAELRKGEGLASGDLLFHPVEQQAEFNITGTGIPLAGLKPLQGLSLPVEGRLDFDLRGSGPLRAPTAKANVRISNLQVGSDIQGNFRGKLDSDGENARLSVSSDLTHGKFEGQFVVGLTGDNRVSGNLAVEQFDLDSFIIAGLHLKHLTGHSSVDGTFNVSGALRQPDTIEVEANIAQISFNYDFVQLHNDGPIKLTYRRNEVRIDQAHLNGPITDMHINGVARFDRDRALHFTLTGGVNLRLLTGLIPDLEAQGQADANVSIEGTMSRPRITGRASVHDASANYADAPVGLSHVNGDFVFDRSRLLFDGVTAESGGGKLTLNGSVDYGEGPLRYEINAATSVVRIRYPAGMSWLAGGTLQLSGTQEAALLSGHVEVQRLLFAEGMDVASVFAAASDTSTTPTSSSPFLRNLTFDIEGQTTPGSRIEWGGAHIELDGNVRLRGTWDRPVLLGHIHLLGGEMAFRGNNFQLTRGDINFANPFRLDPVLNVEATSTIGQYQVTINFSGPASKLALNYRSDPPLPDTDVIALLAVGSTGEENALRSSSSGGQNYGATALLSEAISSGLGGRIEHLFGISHFRVDPFLAGTATESNAAARVTIEQQVTRGLTITYSTNAATSNQYQLIQVEYAVKRDLSIVFLRDINGTYGLEVKFVKHFK